MSCIIKFLQTKHLSERGFKIVKLLNEIQRFLFIFSFQSCIKIKGHEVLDCKVTMWMNCRNRHFMGGVPIFMHIVGVMLCILFSKIHNRLRLVLCLFGLVRNSNLTLMSFINASLGTSVFLFLFWLFWRQYSEISKT